MRKKNRFITSPKITIERAKDSKVTVVLLCDKAGHRMKSYGATSLVKIGTAKLIDMQISSISRVFKYFEIVVCGGFESEKVVRYIRDKYRGVDVRFVENQVFQHTNCCESLRLSLNNVSNDKVLICNGSILITDQLLQFIDDRTSSIIYEKHDNKNLEVGVVVSKNGRPENFCYGIGKKWSEVLFLSGYSAIETMRKVISNIEYKNKFIFEALNEMIKTKTLFESIENIGRPIIKISNIKTYHEVSKIYARTNTKLFNK